VTPRREGKYLFEVTVSDTESVPAKALVALVVEPPGASERPGPVARTAAATIRASIGGTIALDGLGSSGPPGLELAYQWRQVAGGPLGLPEKELRGERVGLRFWRTGTWVFELVVSAGGSTSEPARVTVVVEEKR
jgi:hypothetical protein